MPSIYECQQHQFLAPFQANKQDGQTKTALYASSAPEPAKSKPPLQKQEVEPSSDLISLIEGKQMVDAESVFRKTSSHLTSAEIGLGYKQYQQCETQTFCIDLDRTLGEPIKLLEKSKSDLAEAEPRLEAHKEELTRVDWQGEVVLEDILFLKGQQAQELNAIGMQLHSKKQLRHNVAAAEQITNSHENEIFNATNRLTEPAELQPRSYRPQVSRSCLPAHCFWMMYKQAHGACYIVVISCIIAMVVCIHQ